MNFWKTKVMKEKYPLLSELATSTLGIPPSSASAERMFSIHTAILTAQRMKLTFENFIKYVFIKCNAEYAKEV